MAGQIDYDVFAEMKEHEVRGEIASYVCQSNHLRPDYVHLDTATLIERFNELCDSGERGMLIIASRPFSNLNCLYAAHSSVPITRVIRGWGWYRDRYIRDQGKLQEIKTTFNGPALISNLLPPSDHLAGKFGHPSLVSGNPDAWKEVIGKIDHIQTDLPNSFFLKEDGYGKKSARRERKRISENEKYVKQYVSTVLESFDARGGYPGGSKNLYQRCYSVYFVRVVRTDEGEVRGYEVEWLADYTHKSDRGWTRKSEKVTVPLPKYRIYIHDDGLTFAGWDGASLRAQVEEYEGEDSADSVDSVDPDVE